MSQSDARAGRVGSDRTAVEERVDSRGGSISRYRRPALGVAGVLLAVVLVATLAPGARTALLEGVSYLAPLALFVGVLSAVDG